MLQDEQTPASVSIELHMLKQEASDYKRQRDEAWAQVRVLKSIIENALAESRGSNDA